MRERLPKLRKVVFLALPKPRMFFSGLISWLAELLWRKKCIDSVATRNARKMCLYCNIRQERQACLKESCIVSKRTCVMPRAYGERQGLTTSSVLCSALPFFHAYGNAVILTSLYYGGTLVGVERFQAPLVQAIEQGVTSLSGTPTMFVALLEEWERNSYDKFVVRGRYGGSQLSGTGAGGD